MKLVDNLPGVYIIIKMITKNVKNVKLNTKIVSSILNM